MFGWDIAAERAAHGRGALDLAIGETLLRLFRGDRLLRLGYARRADYARERLGVAACSMHKWTRLAGGLAKRPVLRHAVLCGSVTTEKALMVMRLARGEDEAGWTAAAIHLSLDDLKKRVGDQGHDPGADTFEVESIVLRMTPDQQDRLDAALELAREVVGPGAPRWQRLEAICQEWLGGFGAWDRMVLDRRPRRLDGVCGISQTQIEPRRNRPIRIEPAPSDDPLVLDAHARRLVRQRAAREEELGRLLTRIFDENLWRESGFRCFEHYCDDRLRISARRARERIWLERRLREFPELREAFVTGRLSMLKASLIARHATPFNIAERIEDATGTTWQQLERDATAEEDRRNRTLGIRRLWGPTDAAETVVRAIGAAQTRLACRERAFVGPGEALADIADHFTAVWTVHHVARKMSKRRREVFARHDGLCAVPGCSRPAEQEHHIVFRSHGGSDETWNRVGLCALCRHRHKLHCTTCAASTAATSG